MKTAFLSIDFDFFVREDPLWDWGHSESLIFTEHAWMWRYASIDIHRGTDVEVYADFNPLHLRDQLIRKNISPTPEAKIGIADSHANLPHLYDRLNGEKPDMFIHLDAHHDMFNEPENGVVDCGNWWVPIADKHPSTERIWVVPRWMDGDEYGDPVRDVNKVRWEDVNPTGEAIKFIGMFICRSGAWVPPHFDGMFNKMCGSISQGAMLPVRDAPTMEEADKMREEHSKMLDTLRKINEARGESGSLRSVMDALADEDVD